MWINDKNKFSLIDYPCCCRGMSWEHCVRSLTYCLFVRVLKVSIQLEPQCRKQDVTRVSWRNIWWPKWRHDSWSKIAGVPKAPKADCYIYLAKASGKTRHREFEGHFMSECYTNHQEYIYINNIFSSCDKYFCNNSNFICHCVYRKCCTYCSIFTFQ